MDYFRCVKPCVESEIGKLDYVILHAPGKEIEHMTPENAHKFLFSDILNYHEAMANYRDFEGSLRKVTNVLTFKDLLVDILKKQEDIKDDGFQTGSPLQRHRTFRHPDLAVQPHHARG